MSTGAANSAKQLYDVVKNGPAAPLGLASVLVLAGMLIGEVTGDEDARIKALAEDIDTLENKIDVIQDRINVLERRMSVHESEGANLKTEIELQLLKQMRDHMSQDHGQRQ